MAEPTSSPEGAGTPRPSENADPVAPADSAGTGTAEGRPNVARAATGPDAPAERTAAVPADPAPTSTEPAADRAEAARTPAERPAAAPADARPIFAEPVADRADPAPTVAEPRSEPVGASAAEPAGGERATSAAPAAALDDETPTVASSAASTWAADDRDEVGTRTDDDTGDRTAVLSPAETGAAAAAARGDQPPPAPPEAQPTTPLEPTVAPPPPRRASNRLVGTAWVLLAAGIFEVLYLGVFALVVYIVAGTSAVSLSVTQLLKTPFAWLPVVLFTLFYELAVLLLNRAGRFAYVLATLIVALLVYLLSAILILAMQEGGITNESNLGRALIAPQVVLIFVIAREVMVWTSLAIGARGRRVRRRNQEAQQQYERERFAASVQARDDAAGSTA